ncbi:MAG: DUF222 domain-containing protein [Candidatus Dormibacteria bacterium]
MELDDLSLDNLTEAIDALVASDPSTHADGESIVALHRQLARLDALVTKATGSFDTSGDWAPSGAPNAAMWVATRCRVPKSDARRRVRLARGLAHLPTAAVAWCSGEVTAAHVGALASAANERTQEALARDEALLVDQARTLRFEPFTRALAYWEQQADPEGTEEAA